MKQQPRRRKPRGRAYKSWWNDERHPTEQGFAKVAAKFDTPIRQIA